MAELERKASSVSQVKMAFDPVANKRKMCRFMTPPMGCEIIPGKRASIMPAK
jgi:hypothetical protein